MTNAWDIVKLARDPKRPTAKDVIEHIFDDFIELHGDRQFADDASIIAGLGYFNQIPITIIAEEKGIDTNDKIKRNFGMPHPEGYRKALRLMKQAEKFNRPIFTIIDTPGAYPGLGAEERGQAQAIAYNLQQMMGIKVPIICLVLSEGGSGGALAIGVGDHVMMFENSIYSILSPEGFASILYKDAQKAEDAANIMKLTANDLLNLKVIDTIITEDVGLHIDKSIGYKNLKKALTSALKKEMKNNNETRLLNRYKKYRKMGMIQEGETNESNI